MPGTAAPKIAIPELNDAEVAFGRVEGVLPDWDDIPKEFWKMHNPYCRVVSSLFFNGGSLQDFGLAFKPGVDERRAMRAIKACLGSWAPKHEHKEAGVAYLLSLWCDGTPKAA